MITVRALTSIDAERYQTIRLYALRNNPEAFAETPEEQMMVTGAVLESILSTSHEFPQRFVLGAFSDHDLIGLVGFRRDAREKLRHIGHVWGMFVVPEMRGSGIGQKLLNDLFLEIKKFDGLEQLQLWVSSMSKEAELLYEKFGFQSCGVTPEGLNLGSSYVDLKIMTCKLNSN